MHPTSLEHAGHGPCYAFIAVVVRKQQRAARRNEHEAWAAAHKLGKKRKTVARVSAASIFVAIAAVAAATPADHSVAAAASAVATAERGGCWH